MSRMTTLAAFGIAVCLAAPVADACTRFHYEGAKGDMDVGRTLDWMDDPRTDLWAFPKGMKRDGGIDSKSIQWTSRYGSVIASMYDIGSVDGINEAGLVANLLYLAEADYGTAAKADKPSLSVGAWGQYALDNFATVAEAVTALQAEPFRIVAPLLPGGHAAGTHLALSDASGDNAVFEYIGGKLVIHHNRQYRTMTNSPSFDQQLAINAYWEEIGGTAMLPGTTRAADRFVRATYNLKATPKYDDTVMSVAASFSQIRAISVPIGIQDPKEPNLAPTHWRTVADIKNRTYYFDSVMSPMVFWVELAKLDLSAGAAPKKLDLKSKAIYSGEVSAQFKPATPFAWLKN